MRHRLLAFVGAVSGFLAALLAYRRWLGGRRGRVDLYYADGSFVTFVEGSEHGDRLLAVARQVLASVHRTPSEWPPE